LLTLQDSVDKSNFLHKLKGLARVRCAEQALYPACTKGAQFFRRAERTCFCTFAPVDMHGFVHSRFGRRTRWHATSAMPANLTLASNTSNCDEKIFLRAARLAPVQVYNQK
jgi:hypothetical protein